MTSGLLPGGGGGGSDTIAPSVPSNVTASDSQNNSDVTVSWSPSTDNTGVTGYNVRYKIIGGSWVSTSSVTSSPKNLGGGLADGDYVVQVQAFDAEGNVSNWSLDASFNVSSVIT